MLFRIHKRCGAKMARLSRAIFSVAKTPGFIEERRNAAS
jgi:hypothetical protein